MTRLGRSGHTSKERAVVASSRTKAKVTSDSSPRTTKGYSGTEPGSGFYRAGTLIGQTLVWLSVVVGLGSLIFGVAWLVGV